MKINVNLKKRRMTIQFDSYDPLGMDNLFEVMQSALEDLYRKKVAERAKIDAVREAVDRFGKGGTQVGSL